MVCFGDSVMWGQGLVQHRKYAYGVWALLVGRKDAADDINRVASPSGPVHRGANDAGRKDGALEEDFEMHAHSGAVIGISGAVERVRTKMGRSLYGVREMPDWLRGGNGNEIGAGRPTIAEQVGAYDNQPETVRIVLLNGGGNDIGVGWYMNPLTSLAALQAAIDRYCGQDMLVLIRRVAKKFPNACIVVPGYVQSLSRSTENNILKDYFSKLFPLVPVLRSRWVLDRVFERNAFFREQTSARLRATVAQANAEILQSDSRRLEQAMTGKRAANGSAPKESPTEALEVAAAQALGSAVQLGNERSRPDAESRQLRFPEGRVVFSDAPGFRSENAANGKSPWVWGIDLETLRPQDPLRDFRLGACARFGRWSPWYFASVGHPNADGAWRIRNAIIRNLLRWAERTRRHGNLDEWTKSFCAAIDGAAADASLTIVDSEVARAAIARPVEFR